MSKSLVVCGKKYYSSVTIAQTFNYTPDYVSKIAREGKVEATRVGRQWFIDEDSVHDFVRLKNVNKLERKVLLQKERQAERLIHQLKQNEQPKNNDAPYLIALTQSLAVIACGFIVGALGWTVVDNETGITEIVSGATSVTEQIFARVAPSASSLKIISQWSSVATVGSSVRGSQDVQSSEEIISEAVSHTVQVLEFSDEVEVLFKDDEGGVVRPIFKNGQSEETYQVFIEPVRSVNKN